MSPLFRLLCATCLSATVALAEEPALQLAAFRADVTPPIGAGPCVGFMPQVSNIEHPLEIRGIVLQAHGQTYVLAAIDYQGLCNASDDEFRRHLAEAAGTTADRVALQSLHQHTAPVLDAEAVRLLHGDNSEELHRHVAFTALMSSRASAAVRAALPKLQPVVQVIGSRALVERVASNRRVPLPDGSLMVRGSATRDPQLQDAPEGLIDAWLRTVTFLAADGPLVQLHYYATHPQSFYGDARISWDVPGLARQPLERETGVFQVYFTGCGGNIGMGKYNDGTSAARDRLAGRLGDAMRRSARVAAGGDESETAKRETTVDVSSLQPTDVVWDRADVQFTVRDEGPFASAALREQLQAGRPFPERLKAAMYSAWASRLLAGHRASISRLRLGPLQLVQMPGEPFVEFQLFAQQVATPKSFVCVAGYGECGVWYFGPDAIFRDRGGYEQTWSFTGPCQASVEMALMRLLSDRQRHESAP